MRCQSLDAGAGQRAASVEAGKVEGAVAVVARWWHIALANQ